MNLSILAVDDELHMLRLLELLITKKTPYQLVTTSNALEVPELLAEIEFDVIITDMIMPGIGGIDILRLVDEQKRPEKVIVITAFGTPENEAVARSLGAVDYIHKPFTKDRILKSLEKIITEKQKENG